MWCLPGRSKPPSSPESGGDDAVKQAGLVGGCPFCRIAAEAPAASTSSSSSLSPASPAPPGNDSHDTNPTTAATSSSPLAAPSAPATRVVLTSDRFVAFHDRTPRAKVHLLAVPREHVGSVKELPSTEAGAELVEALHAFGRRALETVSPSATNTSTTTLPPRRLYGFHIPPFNSVDHLHLHCLESPLTARARIKYCATAQKGDKLKGWTWFVTAEQTAEILRRGERVKVGSVYAKARGQEAVA